jgi:hypothetical protein
VDHIAHDLEGLELALGVLRLDHEAEDLFKELLNQVLALIYPVTSQLS